MFINDTCYDRGTPLFFLILPLNFGAYDLSQKLIWSVIKLLPDEKSHGLGTQHENRTRKRPISNDFGLRSPVIQKKNQPESATSIVTPVN